MGVELDSAPVVRNRQREIGVFEIKVAVAPQAVPIFGIGRFDLRGAGPIAWICRGAIVARQRVDHTSVGKQATAATAITIATQRRVGLAGVHSSGDNLLRMDAIVQLKMQGKLRWSRIRQQILAGPRPGQAAAFSVIVEPHPDTE